jgi:hypothetical protein
MPLLHIAFQEGFTGEAVEVRINGNEAYRKEQMKTRFQLGYAGSFEVNVEEGSVRVEVLLPAQNLSETFEVQVSEPTYVGVSLEQNQIVHRVSTQPFGYV